MAVYDILGECAPLRGLMESSVSAGYLSPAVAALAPFYTDAEQLLDALEQGENAGD